MNQKLSLYQQGTKFVERCWGCGRLLPDGTIVHVRAYDPARDDTTFCGTLPIVSYAECCWHRGRPRPRRAMPPRKRGRR